MAENEVRVMIDEIGKLSHSDMQMTEFYREVLGRLNDPLQAKGMAAWVCDGESVELLAHRGLEESSLLNGKTTGPQHMGLLDNVRGQGQGIFVPPGQMAEGSEAGNPTEFAVGICPVKLGNDVVALVESFQELNGNPQHYEQSMKLMAMVAQVVAEFHRSAELRWRRRMDIFSLAINRSLHPIETAFSIANDGRTVVGCDRLSVAIKRGRKYRMEAISGLEQIHRRANEVRSLQDLVRRVLATGEPFSYPDPTVEMPPQLEEVVHDYVDESQTRFMTVLPLLETPKSKDHDDPDRQKKPEIIGAVIAERFSGEPFSPQRVETIAQHGQRALNNSLGHHRIFLLPLWTAIGNMHWLVRARTLPWTILVVSLIFAAVMGAIFVPQEFKLTAEGTLEPEIKRFVFATEEGRIEDDLPEHTRHGAFVEKGAPLAVMSNTTIDVELERINGDIGTTLERVEFLHGRVTTMKRRTPQDETTYNEYSAELLEKRKWLESLHKQRELLLDQQKSLTIVSPISGSIITWDVRELLRSRPVSKGQILMTVADLKNGPWILELLLADKRLGHLHEARKKLEGKEVSFNLATDPGTTLKGEIKDVAQSTKVDEEEGMTVKVTVEINEDEIKELRPGAEVVGRIHCGQRSVGYVWLIDIYEFYLRSKFRYLW